MYLMALISALGIHTVLHNSGLQPPKPILPKEAIKGTLSLRFLIPYIKDLDTLNTVNTVNKLFLPPNL